MKFRHSFIGKASSGLLLTMLAAAPAFANDQVSVICVDISTVPATTRVLELAASPVNAKYYSLAGTHRNQAGATVGSAVGTALVGNDELIITVNASSTVGTSTMEATLYQFNFNVATLKGPYQGITQQSNSGYATHKAGQAALIPCDAPVTEFSGGGTTTYPPGCKDDDLDGDLWCAFSPDNDCNDTDPAINADAQEICGNDVDENCDGSKTNGCTSVDTDADDDGSPDLVDCDDSNASIYPGAAEICGNDIDEDCSGADLTCPTTTDADDDGYSPDSVTSAPDCNDNNRAIHPGASEICGNGIDEDCSGADLTCPVTYPSFTANTDGLTLNQTGTSLVWQRQHYLPPASNPTVNWISATEYCDNLVMAGANNWRLPTKNELLAILDPRYANPDTLTLEPMIDPLFKGAVGTYYWTSTVDPERPDSYVYDVNFGTGVSRLRHQQTTSPLTRCVRTR